MIAGAAFLEAGLLSLLAMHVVNSVIVNRREPWGQSRLHVTALVLKYAALFLYPWLMSPRAKRAKRKFHLALLVAVNLPLFAIACCYGARQGVFSRHLVSPLYIGMGLAAGHLVFVLSVLMANLSYRDAMNHFWDFGSLWMFLTENPLVLSKVLGVSVAEELIWRVAAQSVLIGLVGHTALSVAVGILVVAACFAVVHKHFFKNPLMVSIEFLCFSVLLGLLYYWTGSLILVVVIHAIRNLEVSYLESVEEVEDLLLTWVILSNGDNEASGMALIARIEGRAEGLAGAAVALGRGAQGGSERI